MPTIDQLSTGRPFAAVLSPFTGPREFQHRRYTVLLSYRRERTEAQYVADSLTPIGELMPRMFAATEAECVAKAVAAIDARETLPAEAGPPAERLSGSTVAGEF